METDLIYKDYEGEYYTVRYNRAHKWFYCSHQRQDEVILIQNFDSLNNTREQARKKKPRIG